jgi:transcriptional regulator with XRE-family HTH domain
MKFGITKNPSDFLEEIASRHKVLRKEARLSKLELAQKSGVSLGSLKRFEQTGQISFESLLKLAQVLGRLDDFEEVLKPSDLKNIEKLFSDKTRKS